MRISENMRTFALATIFAGLAAPAMLALGDQADAAELRRTVVPPYAVTTPEQARTLFYPMFKAPRGRFAVFVRWQGPDIVSTPNDYDASAETHFRPPAPLTNWQYGPRAEGRRSTYQAYGTRVGFLSLTRDAELPAEAPPAADRHATYAYRFEAPYPIFQDPEPRALMLEARVSVPKFTPFHYAGNQGRPKEPLGTLYFGMGYYDRTNPSIRQIPFSVLMFESRGDKNKERIFVDPSNRRMTATSRLSADRRGKLYTSLSKGSAVLTGTPFSDQRLFRFYITPENFRNLIAGMNAKGAGLSTDLKDYSILRFGIVQEQAMPKGDHSEMASTIADFGLYEVAPELYLNDIRK